MGSEADILMHPIAERKKQFADVIHFISMEF